MITSKVRREVAAKSIDRAWRTEGPVSGGSAAPGQDAAMAKGVATEASSEAAEWRPLTRAELSRLPWPTALLDATAQLTADETFEVGRLIVEVVHGGQRNTRKSRKPWSLRRLQREVLSAASFATLARCVQTYETCRSLGLEPPLGDVRAGHLLQLTHAPRSKQRHWLRQVDREGLSVEQLRETTLRTGRVTRPRKPGVVKALAALQRQSMLEGLDELSLLPRAEVRKLSKHVHQAKAQLKQVEKALRRLGVE
jgi:hypothetical protein